MTAALPLHTSCKQKMMSEKYSPIPLKDVQNWLCLLIKGQKILKANHGVLNCSKKKKKTKNKKNEPEEAEDLLIFFFVFF